MVSKQILFSIFIFIVSCIACCGQENNVKILLPQYGTYFDLPQNYKIGDTLVWKVTKDKYVKIIFFDFRGKSYSEVFDGKNLIERGYYVNSLDTLKRYSSSNNRGKQGRISVLKYFEPLKNGSWIEMRQGKLVSVSYRNGEEL